MNTELTLFHEFLLGRQFAFQELYDLYSASTYQLAIHILKDESKAEEIVQDTFLQLWNIKKKLDPNGNLPNLLYVIARNKCFNQLKQQKREQRIFEPLDTENIYSNYLADDLQQVQELNEIIENILQNLPERQQLIFRLCRIEGLSHKEIAAELNISVQTVKNQMVSAQRFVKEKLLQIKGEEYFVLIPFLIFFL